MNLKTILPLMTILIIQFSFTNALSQTYSKGKLLYSNPLSDITDTADWRMEGFGDVQFSNGWMKLFSAKEKGHHVFWCPQEFPSNFIAEWEVQNLHIKAGLCIVFFSAKGINGEDIFNITLPKRDGTFSKYTKGDINNYHISYYANSKDQPGRETAHLRKNKGFHKVQDNEMGIPICSQAIHKIQLIKFEGIIQLFIDGRKVIDWVDDGQKFGKILQGGKIGFRQMKWTQFNYRNFNVWEYKKGTKGKQ
jgi:Domain of unknown function (DUF1961)